MFINIVIKAIVVQLAYAAVLIVIDSLIAKKNKKKEELEK